ncbi:phage minor capsid protein [Rhodococcus sp. NPDC055024]
MRRHVASLDAVSAWEIESAVGRAHSRGAVVGQAEVAAVRAQPITFSAAGVIDTRAVSALAYETINASRSAQSYMLRSTDDAYRRVIAEVSGRVITGVSTRQQAAQQALNNLARQGITGFVDARNRQWSASSYVEMALRTSTHRAMMQGHAERLQSAGFDLVLISSHPNPAPMCQPYEGKVLSLSGNTSGTVQMNNALDGSPMSVEVYSSIAEARMNGFEHPNCFPADTMVTSPSGLKAVDKRWYEGDMVVIRTASGNELTSTPNHPILTPEGWVGAGSLKVGQSVFRNSVDVEGSGVDTPDHEDVPAPISEVFDSFRGSVEVTSVSVPSSAEQFHGDGEGSDVEIVFADRLLSYGVDAQSIQSGGDGELFVGSHRLRPLFPLGSGLKISDVSDLPLDGFMSGSDLPITLLGSHLRPLESFGLGSGSLFDVTEPGESGADVRLGDPEVESDLGLSHSGAVHFGGFGDPLGARVVGTSDETCVLGGSRDVSGFESVVDEGLAYAETVREVCDGLAGLVTEDEIVDIDRRVFAGHVYNLESGDGWYTADSVIVHNCRHTHTLLVPGASQPAVAPYDPQGYKDSQRQRYLERGVRRAREHQAVQLTAADKKAARARVKTWQDRAKEHSERTGIPRHLDRERVRVGDPSLADAPQLVGARIAGVE